MTPTTIMLGVLFTVCAFLPIITSAFFGYRTGERLAITIGVISGLVLLMSCGLLAYLPHISEQSSEEERHLALFVVFATGVPALCTFMGTVAGYIGIGLFGSEHEKD